jgi:hypothetical protein
MPSTIQSTEDVAITAEMTGTEAYALAQFFKRASYEDFRKNAVSDEDAYNMIYAAGIVRKALATKGYDPR